MSDQPHLITDAAPSLDEEQARRRRTYAILMVVHIVGFALSYPLYLWQPWAGVAAVVLTGVLPWAAVLLANDPPRRAVRKPLPPTPTIHALPHRSRRWLGPPANPDHVRGLRGSRPDDHRPSRSDPEPL